MLSNQECSVFLGILRVRDSSEEAEPVTFANRVSVVDRGGESDGGTAFRGPGESQSPPREEDAVMRYTVGPGDFRIDSFRDSRCEIASVSPPAEG